MDEEGNQGYYLYNEATGEEKLFSVVEEEREFAKKKDVEPETDKLRFRDEVTYIGDKYLTPKQVRKAHKAFYKGEVGKTIVEGGKVYLPVGTVVGGIVGGATTKSVKGALRGAGVGAALGAGSTASLGVGAASKKLSRKLSPIKEELADRRVDQIKMASGEMSKKDFKKKYYNKKRIKRLNED